MIHNLSNPVAIVRSIVGKLSWSSNPTVAPLLTVLPPVIPFQRAADAARAIADAEERAAEAAAALADAEKDRRALEKALNSGRGMSTIRLILYAYERITAAFWSALDVNTVALQN